MIRRAEPRLSLLTESRSTPGGTSAVNRRQMNTATLSGHHEHNLPNGTRVHIWIRDGRYLARWRQEGRQHGHTLGADQQRAEAELRNVLTSLETGTYRSRSEAAAQRFRRGTVPQHDLRGLFNAFLADSEARRGKNTAGDYENRLQHILQFAEQPNTRRNWPLARDVNREFVIQARNFLAMQQTTANGRPGATVRLMSATMRRHCLETFRAAIVWAARREVNQLPADFVSPFTPDVMESKVAKNPVRQAPLTIDVRIRLVQSMDYWQLLTLGTLLVLPTRFEDVSGAILSDFDLAKGTWYLGSRFNGFDFNKGRVTVEMPLPPTIRRLLQLGVRGRSDGPMFRSRRAWHRPAQPAIQFSSREEFERQIQAAIGQAPRNEVATPQDRKQLIRDMIRRAGAVTTDTISKELRKLFTQINVPGSVPPYAIRAAVTTEMHAAGIQHLDLRYLTLHSANDILNTYTCLDPATAVQPYFERIGPLLAAIDSRLDAFEAQHELHLSRTVQLA